MIITHPGCDAKWTGLTYEHCTACHKTFAGTTAGDAHRVGPPEKRRCLTTEEMRAKKIKTGALAGESFFTTVLNPHGTEIWRRNTGQNPLWTPVQHFSDGLGEGSATDRLGVAA